MNNLCIWIWQRLLRVKMASLPKKPTVSCALAHYLLQANVLPRLWKALFDFELDVKRLPSKALATQFMLILRCLLYFHTQAKALPTAVMANKLVAIRKDAMFLKDISTFIRKHLSKEMIKKLKADFQRPVGGSPVYAQLYRQHKARMESMDSNTNNTSAATYVAWVKIANGLGDTNTTFKPSALKLLPKGLIDGFVRHDLKKGKVIAMGSGVPARPVKRTHQGIAKPQKSKKTTKSQKPSSTPTLTNPASKPQKPQKPSVHRYPAPPTNGWMGLMTGTALCNFVSHISAVSGNDFQFSIAKVSDSKHVMLMKTKVQNYFMLQTTGNMTLFQSQLDRIPNLIAKRREIAAVSKHFVKTAVCLVFHPANPAYDLAPTLTLSSVGAMSSISFTIVVQVVKDQDDINRKCEFHALCTISLAIKLLKPLMLEKVDAIHVLCQVDNVAKRHYIKLTTKHPGKAKLTASQLFSAALDKPKAHRNTSLSPMDKVSLFTLNKTDMYVGKILPTMPSASTTVQRAYVDAQSKNQLQTVFSETYKIGLLKAITKGIPDNQKICLVMSKERFLLMTIHEYRGSIQVGQIPMAT